MKRSKECNPHLTNVNKLMKAKDSKGRKECNIISNSEKNTNICFTIKAWMWIFVTIIGDWLYVGTSMLISFDLLASMFDLVDGDVSVSGTVSYSKAQFHGVSFHRSPSFDLVHYICCPKLHEAQRPFARLYRQINCRFTLQCNTYQVSSRIN